MYKSFIENEILVLGQHIDIPIYPIAGNFRGSKFSRKSRFPPEEIFAVLIFAFSASASFGPRPFIAAGLTEAERSHVGDGRTSSAGLK